MVCVEELCHAAHGTQLHVTKFNSHRKASLFTSRKATTWLASATTYRTSSGHHGARREARAQVVDFKIHGANTYLAILLSTLGVVVPKTSQVMEQIFCMAQNHIVEVSDEVGF